MTGRVLVASITSLRSVDLLVRLLCHGREHAGTNLADERTSGEEALELLGDEGRHALGQHASGAGDPGRDDHIWELAIRAQRNLVVREGLQVDVEARADAAG